MYAIVLCIYEQMLTETKLFHVIGQQKVNMTPSIVKSTAALKEHYTDNPHLYIFDVYPNYEVIHYPRYEGDSNPFNVNGVSFVCSAICKNPARGLHHVMCKNHAAVKTDVRSCCRF